MVRIVGRMDCHLPALSQHVDRRLLDNAVNHVNLKSGRRGVEKCRDNSFVQYSSGTSVQIPEVDVPVVPCRNDPGREHSVLVEMIRWAGFRDDSPCG